jgi:hypothetical protein
MLACLHGIDSNLGMPMVYRTDENDIDVVVLQQFAMVFVYLNGEVLTLCIPNHLEVFLDPIPASGVEVAPSDNSGVVFVPVPVASITIHVRNGSNMRETLTANTHMAHDQTVIGTEDTPFGGCA